MCTRSDGCFGRTMRRKEREHSQRSCYECRRRSTRVITTGSSTRVEHTGSGPTGLRAPTRRRTVTAAWARGNGGGKRARRGRTQVVTGQVGSGCSATSGRALAVMFRRSRSLSCQTDGWLPGLTDGRLDLRLDGGDGRPCSALVRGRAAVAERPRRCAVAACWLRASPSVSDDSCTLVGASVAAGAARARALRERSTRADAVAPRRAASLLVARRWGGSALLTGRPCSALVRGRAAVAERPRRCAVAACWSRASPLVDGWMDGWI